MNEQRSGQDVEADMKRRIHRVGTGASNAPGHLDTNASPGTADADKDVEGRIRRRGTGGSDHPGRDD